MKSEQAERAMRSWEEAQALRARSAPSCRRCRWNREDWLDEARCTHPVIAPISFDPMSGKYRNERVPTSAARRESGKCGPQGFGYEQGWLAAWWAMGGAGRAVAQFIGCVAGAFAAFAFIAWMIFG